MGYKEDKTKILEMICAEIIPDISEELQEISLTENNIKRDGFSFNSALSILKDIFSEKKIIKLDITSKEDGQRIAELLISPSDIEEILTELKYPELDLEWGKWDENLAKGKKAFEVESSPELKFDKEASVLYLNDKKVLIQQKTDKPNAHYILEYIFENEEGLKANSFYSEILESKFPKEQKNWRSVYRACNDINKKVSEQALVSNFLIVKSGVSGYTQINPNYL